MAATAGRAALIRVPGAGVAFTQEATTGNAGRTVYTISNAVKSIWDPQIAVLVETSPTGSVWTTANPSTYSLNRLAGSVTFFTPLGAGYFVRVSGTYLPTSIVAGGKSWTYTITSTLLDATDYDNANTNGGFPTKIPNFFDASGSISRWYQAVPDLYFVSALTNASFVVIEFTANRAVGYDCRIWGILNKEQVQANVTALTDESVDFEGFPDIDGHVVSN